MPEVTLRRIPFTVESENRLRVLQARTGLHRNLLCRTGFCLSLEEPGIPAQFPVGGKVGREIDRYTLLGQHALAYVSLLVMWINENEIFVAAPDSLDRMLVAHMNRGVEILTSRVRTLADMASLLPRGREATHHGGESHPSKIGVVLSD
jgi:DNA sulfur modification protein DndE